MKILLDECVPWPMHRLLAGHECRTAQQCGWGGIKNGSLLELAEKEFPLFITSDQNLRYQQNLAGRQIAILELSTNKLRRMRCGQQSKPSSRASSGNWRFRSLQTHMKPVAIIGGRITGLTVGFYLQRAGIPVTTAKFNAGAQSHNVTRP